MSKRSIVQISSSEVRKRRSGVVKSTKKQRKLCEFDIPTASSLEVRQRSFEEVIIQNNQDDPIVIEEEDEEIVTIKQIKCPICQIDITNFEIYQKEAHAESCLEKSTETASKRLLTAKVVTRPKLPQIKIVSFVNGHKIVVDGFNFERDPEISQYFLSHFHSDHYMGLRKSWDHGTIYGSQITVDLMINKFNINRDLVRALPMDQETWIEANISVIPLDANHCPGATVFLFQEWDHTRQNVVKQILHTGDFRSNPQLISRINSICSSALDQVYLDTTYLIPGYHFPSQDSVLSVTSRFACQVAEKGIRHYFNDSQQTIFKFISRATANRTLYKCLFLVGTYTIGKEKLAISIAQALNTKIFVSEKSSRHKIISQYISYFPEDLITHDVKQSCVHLVPLSTLKSKESIDIYFKEHSKIYQEIIGFIPTGWTFTNRYAKPPHLPTQDSRIQYCEQLLQDNENNSLDLKFILKQYKKHNKYQIFNIPYSEHSSFKDLALFGTQIHSKEILATVNLHSLERIKDMHQWFKTWQAIRATRCHRGIDTTVSDRTQ
ncbi:hypothetical protein HG537_0A03180 [Torulaspora globosa]|uniref:DNA repair metallo-beta-lactamase domain-containing protein n=1 Tax=Torulaspora globosa TaxID=48254 RepID=A0A7H9HLL2_9SACH|nr:hypothetical protein HG537_0A03180 [Torulaspora sp. CBS 2947]